MNDLRRLFTTDRKNSGAVIGAFLLLIVLSQPRTFQFMMNTFMGRFSLALVVAIMTYVHTYLGVIAVLMIIISVNYHDTNPIKGYNYYQYEGFTTTNDPSSNGLMQDISGNKATKQPALPSEETKALIQETVRATLEEKKVNVESAPAREGFCLSDKESNILRGKQSNSVPVLNRKQNEDVSPSNGSLFEINYSPY